MKKHCGKEIEMRNMKGMSFPYKEHKALALKYDFHTRYCTVHKDFMFSGTDCIKLDELLEKSLGEGNYDRTSTEKEEL